MTTTTTLPEAPPTGEARPVGQEPSSPAPAPARRSSPARSASRVTAVFRGLLVALALAVVAVNLDGIGYYASPLVSRVRHPLHPWLKPSGAVGQTLGLLAAGLFFFLWLYPLRKRFAARLAFTGRLTTWLDCHVAAGLLIPLLAATHAGWRFTGLVGLGYAAMFLVWLSGIVGRYVYVHIPRKRDGLEMSRDEISAERNRILFEFTAATGLRPSVVRDTLGADAEGARRTGVIGTLVAMVRHDLARRRAARAIEAELSRPGGPPIDRATLASVLKLARKEMALAQQARMLDATQRVFRYWHVFHRPLAVTALFAVVTHIVVAILFGATWFY